MMTRGRATFRRNCSASESTSISPQPLPHFAMRAFFGSIPVVNCPAKRRSTERKTERRKKNIRFIHLKFEITDKADYTIGKTCNYHSDYRINDHIASFLELLVFSHREDHLYTPPSDPDDTHYCSNTDSIRDDIAYKYDWSRRDNSRWYIDRSAYICEGRIYKRRYES